MPRHEDTGSENQEGAATCEALRDEGNHFLHVQQYNKAIESFTKALELKPDDEHCLVTRSKCYLQVGNADAALVDAESALQQNKDQIKGLFQKAEALYQKGDFETGLMFYHRGNKLRPELQEFRLGIQKSQEAINNSIGTPDSVKLSANRGDMSYFYKQEEAKKQQKGAYQKPSTKKEERKERNAPKGSSDAKTVKQLLGELYGDKTFLQKLLEDQSLTGNSKRNDMSREIKDKVCDGLEYLYSRADFWQKQKPMYARKRDKDKQREEWNKSRRCGRDSMEKVLRNLEEIEEAQAEGRYVESLERAKSTLKIVENSSEDDIQNKAELSASLLSSIGNAYMELGKLNQAMDYHQRDLDIARENNLEDAKSRALDNLGRVHARRGEYEKAIEVWQEKIPTSKSPLESTWLYHEIGRCYLELGKFSEARDYGEKSLIAAREADDSGWQLHGTVLRAQAEVKLCEYQAAAESFEKSLELAKQQHDDAAEQAITKALDEVNDKIVKGVKDGDGDDDDKYEEDFDTEKVPSPKIKSPSPLPKQPTPELSPEPVSGKKSVSIKETEEDPPAKLHEPGAADTQEPTSRVDSPRDKTTTDTDKEQTDKEQTDKEQTDKEQTDQEHTDNEGQKTGTKH